MDAGTQVRQALLLKERQADLSNSGRRRERDMNQQVTIYHNPACSKSRETLELLRGRVGEPEVVEYLQTPPDAGCLGQLLDMLGMEAQQLLRTKEEEYTRLGLSDKLHDREALIQAMVEHPVLIERPIVVSGRKARLGRPPEDVLEIL